MNNTNLTYTSILANQADVMEINNELYPINDSTLYNVGMLYMNDINFPNKIYKYNLYTNTFQDTIVVNGNILDIKFK